jgi:hypothetical protein
VVAGDHHDPDAGRLRLGDRVPDLGAGRVDHADHAGEDELVLERLVGGRRLGRVERTVGDGERAQGLIGQPVDRAEDLPPALVRQRHVARPDTLASAARQQDIRGALGHQRDLAAVGRVRFERAHQLPLGAERDLAAPAESAGALLRRAELSLRDEERRLGRIALHRPAAVVAPQDGVAGEAAAAQHRAHLGPQRPALDRAAVDRDLPGGLVAGAADRRLTGAGDDAQDRHLVAGQGAGLVGSDDRRRAERLDGRQALHDRAAAGHPLDADGEDHRQDGRQAFGHGGDGQRYGEQEHVDEPAGDLHLRGEEDRRDDDQGDDDDGDPERPPDEVDLALERRPLPARPAQQLGDATHLGRHARRGDHRAAAAAGDRGAAEQHVQPVAQRCRLVEATGILEHRLALPGQRRLGHGERGRLQQPAVRRDRVALADHENVTRNHLVRGDPPLLGVPHHRGTRSGHPLQRRDGLLGLALLDEAEDAVGHHDQGDDDRLDRRAGRALEGPRRQRHGDRRDQQVDQRAGELAYELAPRGDPRRGVDPVPPEPGEPRGRLAGGQPGDGIAVDQADDRGRVHDRGVGERLAVRWRGIRGLAGPEALGRHASTPAPEAIGRLLRCPGIGRHVRGNCDPMVPRPGGDGNRAGGTCGEGGRCAVPGSGAPGIRFGHALRPGDPG